MPRMKNQNSDNSGWLYYLPTLVLATLALFLRADSLHHFSARSLWAEDGPIFLHDAGEHSITSLFTPYAGYYHLYPRIVALISSLSPITNRPDIMLGGWFLAFYFNCVCAARFLKSINATIIHSAATVFLISMQPNNGEVFFTVTNAQWHLGTALAFIAFSPVKYSSKLQTALIAGVSLLIGLTGPFSVVIATAIMAMALVTPNTDWKKSRLIHLSIVTAAIIQIYCLTHEPRLSKISPSSEINAWITGFWRYTSLGTNTKIGYILSMILLCNSVFMFFKIHQCKNVRFAVLGILLTAIGLSSASMLSFPDPTIATPLGEGGRYTWIPYSLLIAASSSLAIRSVRWHATALALTVLILWIPNFSKAHREDLNFKSFSKLATITEVIIPINPVWPAYPGWSIKMSPDSSTTVPSHQSINATQQSLQGTNGATTAAAIDQKHIDKKAAEAGLPTGISCSGATDIGVEIYMTRSDEGQVTLFWSDNNTFDDKYSFQRWYPRGSIKAQFAFPSFPGTIFLRIDPHQSGAEHADIKEIRIYCLN